jgi:hypothetical protein
MKVAIISPTAHLSEFSKQGDLEMCLLSVAAKDPKYLKYYQNARRKGRVVIADNGIYEEGASLSTKEIIELAMIIKPQMVVTPEVFGDCNGTLKVYKEFIKAIAVTPLVNSEFMTVAHGKNFHELMKCIDVLEGDSFISMIGLPFNIRYWGDPTSLNIALNRVRVVNQLQDFGVGKHIHLMGCSDPIEMLFHNLFNTSAKFLYSQDTSSAVVHGMNGIAITERGLPCEKIKEKLDFSMTIPKEKHMLINQNIKMIKKLASGDILKSFPPVSKTWDTISAFKYLRARE